MARQRKPYLGIPMEGVIASWYAKNTGRHLKAYLKQARSISERQRSRSPRQFRASP